MFQLVVLIYIAFTPFIIVTTNAQESVGRCDRFPVQYGENTQNADYIIGGMFPVHFYNSKKAAYSYNSAGLTWLQAMTYAIEEINNSTSFLPNKTLGFQIYDSCNTINIAVEATLQLTQGFEIYGMNITCPCQNTRRTAVAIIGDAASETTTRVAAITAATRTAQISYSATSTDLSAKHLYPSFLRTIPPDNFQAVLIGDLMHMFQWRYVNIIGSDDNYGRVGVNDLLPELKKLNICVAISEVYDIKNDENSAQTREIIKKLKNEKEATVIVLWAQRPEAVKVLEEAERQQLYHRTWIGTESYGRAEEVEKIHPGVVGGMIAIIPAQLSYAPFEQRLKTITPNQTNKNPWLHEYWQTQKNCQILPNNKYHCNEKEVNLSDLPRNKYVNVIDSVYAIAHGLHNYIQDTDTGTDIAPNELLRYVQNVSFIGKSNSSISFNELGDPGEAIYSLTNLRRNELNELKFEEVGMWNYRTRNISFRKQLEFANQSKVMPRSSCTELCRPGEKGLSFGDRPCCLKCVKCPFGEIQPDYGKSFCIACKGENLPNKNQTGCIEPELQYLRLNTTQGTLLISLMAIGYLLIISGIIIGWIFKDTPMVKAANRGLSLLQLTSILFIFALPLISFTKKPTKFMCGARLYYFVGFCSIAVSVTFTKADRLLRIFKASKTGVLSKNSIMKGNKIQYVTVSVLSVVGLILCTVVYLPFRSIIEKETQYISTDKVHVWYYCSGYHDSVLFVLVGYIALIALICGVYAFKARKLPETYNEARYTSFAMFTFLLVWLMFVPIYFSTKSKVDRIATWCFVSSTSGLVLFLTMYVPKFYIVLFRPDENTQERFRAKMKENNALETPSPGHMTPSSSSSHVVDANGYVNNAFCSQ